jgi:hypothetical protein
VSDRLTIPHNYTPRKYQLPVLRALDSGIKRAVCIWHRRAGKDKTILNIIVKKMVERVGIYYYFFPTYAQGKKILWDGMDASGFKFLDHIPASLVASKNATEMKIVLRNGSVFQIVGTDNYDSIVGTNPVGCVFSEFSLQDPQAWELVRPILRENGGWAIFPYTPRGLNHGWDLYQMALNNPDWFCELLTVKDTGALTEADIDAERRSGMPEPLIQQEFYCSFEHVSGVAFREISKEVHMVDVNDPPDRLKHVFDFDKMTPKEDIHVFRAYDWGYARPACCLWAFADYAGRIYIYREMYFGKANNQGIQMITREQARKIKATEEDHKERPALRVADASLWDKPTNQNERSERLPSNAEIMEREGVFFDRSVSIDAKKSFLQGMHQVHDRLGVDEDGLPGLMVFSTCVHWWRTVPVLPLDPLDPEKYDTTAEDHAADATRYLCSARPFRSHIPSKEPPMYSIEWFYRRQDERKSRIHILER